MYVKMADPWRCRKSARPEHREDVYVLHPPLDQDDAQIHQIGKRGVHEQLGSRLVLDFEERRGAVVDATVGGLQIEHPGQVILEFDPYRRLAFTFHTFVPEIASIADLSEETLARAAAERRSKVSFDIAPDGDQVKLTVIHDDLEPDGTVRQLISGGWPYKLANLKSGLELS